MPRIEDEFTNLPVSRQRKYELRMRRDQPHKYKEIKRIRRKRFTERKKDENLSGDRANT